jgi:acyl-CoA dehydrogenase
MALFLFIPAVWALAYYRAKLPVWTAVTALIVAIETFISHPSGGFTQVIWMVFLVLAVVLNVPLLRILLISKPVYSLFRKKLPPISPTEREALDAGTVWWDGELFSGKPDWDRLLSLPTPGLTEEEKAFLSGPVEELCRMLDDWRIAEDLRDLPPEVWRFILEKGFFGLIIPKEYGGYGFSALAHSQVIMKIAGRSYAAAVTVMVPNSLGPAELLLRYGTQEQKDYYLPRLAGGEEVPCFALTGPEAGSDAASIPDRGVVRQGTYAGEECLGILLNWEKRYITLGPVATVIGLAFRLYDPDLLLGVTDEPGITLALVPVSLPGITIGSRHDPLGIPFQNGPNRGKDVFIPIDFVIGGKGGVGQGWRMLMEGLAAGRSISLPALSTGGAKLTARAVGAYARVRRQFRQPIGRFEGVGEALARIAGNTWLMDAARTVTCIAVDSGERPAVISALLKYHCTELMRDVVNDGMDVMGGRGISMGPRNPIGRLYEAAPIGITVEGANILTRSMIIFGQGVIRCHPFILKEMQSMAMEDTAQGAAEFDRLLCDHVRYTLANAAGALLYGLTGGRTAKAPDGPARRYFQAVTRLSASFALAADVALLTFGGTLKRQESISGRLADILGRLYLVSALLRRFEEKGRPEGELPLLQWGCEKCLAEIRESFTGFLGNLPSRPAAWLLRLLVFPVGRPCAGTRDSLTQSVAAILLEPSGVRDTLTEGLMIPTDPGDPLGRLEDALAKVIAAEPLEVKMREALRKGLLKKGTEVEMLEAALQAGIISNDEALTMWLAVEARREAVRVDEFAVLGGQGKEDLT